MATPILAENVGDLVADTLKDLGKPKYTDISSNLQEHTAMNNLMRRNRMVLESGVGIQFNVLVAQSNNAKHVSPAQSDVTNIVDGMVQASTVWRFSQTSYSIVAQFAAMNREPARIVDWVKQQRIMGLISMVELMERTFWNAPSATDTLTPLGIPYWITKNATKGFNGGTLTGYTTVANLNTTTYVNWNNWTGPYTAVTKDDFIRQAREAALKTKFKPPVDGIPTPNTGDSMGYYTNYGVLQPLEEACESQNDDLGPDVASMDGKTIFRRLPVNWVPILEQDTTNPFYGINWGWLKLYFNAGWWMKETHIPIKAGQHNVSEHFIDCTWNIVSKNRRCHFVISNGTTYPS